ncbi:MAG TPA: protein kinase family protein [Streptosporangiaceae bacterium]|nr:protein kinase family protein [Streptosporangiaceae bacterium]
MSTFISEPGTRLGGRYRLEDRVNASSGWSLWKAIDETLARPVTVLTFAPGFPRIHEVVTAARAASRLSDARLAQVFDVEDDYDRAYVVMEWVAGDSLDDLLADGPMEPARGAEIVAEGAEALAIAHAAGVAHLCLTPDSLRWTPGGGVKVLGLGIDAALTGITADDPALADTQGLGMLLYAALTCHWPGPGSANLPPAPLADGRPCSPRQVRAGVPASIDEVTCQALFQRERRHGPPITTPALLADALAEVIPAPLAPPPAATVPPSAARLSGERPSSAGTTIGGYPGSGGPPTRTGYRSRQQGRDERPVVNRTMVTIVAVLVLAAVGAGVWSLGRNPSGSGAAGHHGHSASARPSTTAVLTPVSAHGFDVYGINNGDPQNENDAQAKFAIDKSMSTAWNTQYYDNNPRFGGLKSGTGLILDMGKQVKLNSVTVTFGSTPGANVAIEVGNNNAVAPSSLGSFRTVAKAKNIGGTYTFKAAGSATGRYVLVWFTKLPPRTGNTYEASIYNIVVRGSG